MNAHDLDIVRQVLDRQVVDANHYNCGKVDDIEIDLSGEPKVKAILIGNGFASERLPEFARWVSQKLFGRGKVRIPWNDVSVITEDVKLAKAAKDYGLEERTGMVYQIIAALPGAWRK
jgi:sporulation protein YlmC with PRC-barrel domain